MFFWRARRTFFIYQTHRSRAGLDCMGDSVAGAVKKLRLRQKIPCRRRRRLGHPSDFPRGKQRERNICNSTHSRCFFSPNGPLPDSVRQVNVSNFGSENVTRFCGSEVALETDATCLFTVLDLEEVRPHFLHPGPFSP